MRLGFHYHTPAYRDENGRLRVAGYLGRFLDSLAGHCEQVVCFLHSPRADEVPYLDYAIQSPNIVWVNIGPHRSVPHRMLHARRYAQPVRSWRDRLDVLLIRGPSPLLPAMANAARDLPVSLLLVGDYVAGVNDIAQPRWRKEAIRLWSRWNQQQQTRVARRALTFVNSRALYEQLRETVPALYETRTTTLTADDFYTRADTCQHKPYHLLYTGRMDRGKGLLDMVEALDVLVRDGEDMVLDLVGWPQKGDAVLEEVQALAAQKHLSERVIYHGFKPVGEELFSFYRQADVYVIASRTSEGFPRTLWEAMAHSLPVVATSVGSLPNFLCYEGQPTAHLTPAGDPLHLAAAIQSLLHDEALRRALIDRGIALARTNLLEERSRELVQTIEQWVQGQP